VEITSTWLENNKFAVENGRHPAIILDTSEDYGGEDSAPTPSELAIMALAGCLGITFKLTLEKMNLKITKLEIKATATKQENHFFAEIHLVVRVQSTEEKEKLEQAFHLAKKNCPVDNIFQQTTIPVTTELSIIQ